MRLLRRLLLLLVASLSLPGEVGSLRCHACESQPTNEDCNTNVTECDESQNDVCYTTIVKTATFNRRYTKGCMNLVKCRKLQALNNRKICSYVPSDCIYCCDDKANCNAYNASPSRFSAASISPLLLLVAYLAV